MVGNMHLGLVKPAQRTNALDAPPLTAGERVMSAPDFDRITSEAIQHAWQRMAFEGYEISLPDAIRAALIVVYNAALEEAAVYLDHEAMILAYGNEFAKWVRSRKVVPPKREA